MATDSQVTEGAFWWIGIVIAITACLIDASGWVIEKGTHTKLQSESASRSNDDKIEQTTTKSSGLQYLFSCRWWCGFITHISGTVLFSASLAFTDASLLMPLQSVTLAFNTIFAWKFLGEILNKKQIFGTILTIIGCAFAVVFGPKRQEASYTADELHDLFRKTDFLIFTALVSITALVDFILYKYVILNDTFLLLSYIFKAGFYASWNTLFIKCFIEVVISSTNSIKSLQENSKSFIPYILFFLICFAKITSEYWRQEALKRYPGNYVGSIYTLFFIVGVILFASIYFNEFAQSDIVSIILFIICVAISFIGVLTLTFGDTKSQKLASNTELTETYTPSSTGSDAEDVIINNNISIISYK